MAHLLRRLAPVVALCCACSGPAASAEVMRFGSEGPGSEQSTPVAISGLTCPTTIDASNRSGYALECHGSVSAWGVNTRGELGDGEHGASLNTAVKVQFPAGVSINAIGEARASGWFVDTTGHVWSVGEGKYCDSKESDVPREVSKLSNVVEVQGGEQHVLFRLGDGHVMACGINAAGELGLPSSVKRRFRPVEVPGLSEVVEVSAGQRQSLARTASGKVYAFGSNAEGQVCMPSSVKHLFTPTEVPLPGRASHISAGGNFVTDGHSFIMVEGVPYGCGDDASGQLGDGKTTNKYAPTVATELLRYEPKAVIAAGETSIGLFGDGEVMTWGSANEGSLGNGSEEGFSLAPFRVDSGAVEVSGTAFDMLYRK